MTKPATLIVRGQSISNRSNRRWLVVSFREEPRTVGEYTYVAFAQVAKRTDSLDVAFTTARRLRDKCRGTDLGVAIIDSIDGQEVGMILIDAEDLVSFEDGYVADISDLGREKEAQIMHDRAFQLRGPQGTLTVCTLYEVEQNDGDVVSFGFRSPSNRVTVRFFND